MSGENDPVLRAAERALSQGAGATVTLRAPVVLKDWHRGRTIRCIVEPADTIGASVILKQAGSDLACARAEWASLRFLRGCDPTGSVAPRLLALDAGAGVCVVEDLGAGQTLEAVLLADDPSRATDVVTGHGAAYARLVTLTVGREPEFDHARDAVGLHDGNHGRRAEAERFVASLPKVERWLEAGRCDMPAGWRACLDRVARCFAEPGEWLAFSHGDPAPSNSHVRGTDEVRLIDFEYGGFRHALYDMTAWAVLCPLPRAALEPMVARYRRGVAPVLAGAGDDARFAEQWAAICAYRALSILTWISPTILEEDRPWASPTWTARQAVLAALARCVMAADGVAPLDPILRGTDALHAALSRRWPEITVRSTGWPALPADSA